MKRPFIVIIALTIWLGCGLFGGAITLANFRGEFPDNYRHKDWATKKCRSTPYIFVMGGPISLLVVLALTDLAYYGATLTCEPIHD